MDIFLGVIIGLLVLMTLVTAHEFGHFILARRNGVRVLEFGICFPPRLVAWVKDSKTKKWKKLPKEDWKKPQEGLVFSLNLIPVGGFCSMDGESAADKRPGTFGKASFWKKTKILFGGVAVNWLIGFIIFTVLAWTGMPKFLDNQFSIASDTRESTEFVEILEVAEGSPAEKAGLKSGDKIISVDGNEYYHASEITDYNEEHAGEEVNYLVKRNTEESDNEFCSITAKLNEKGGDYLLGVTMATSQSLSYATWSAPIVGAGLTLQLTGETFKGVGVMLWNLVSGIAEQFSPNVAIREEGKEAIKNVGDSVSGPIGIIGVLFPAFTSAGPTNLAFLTALISVSLACMNVLPIPALDGGRWLLIAIYKLRKKELTKEIEEKIVTRAFMILLALIFIVTVLDITRFFK